MRSILTLLLLLLIALSAQAEVKQLDNAQLETLLAEGVPVVDIRRAEEWKQTGVVQGSHLITFFDAAGNYDARAWLTQLAPIAGKDDPVILICRTGNRTGIISQFLDQQVGFSRVYNVTKGITDWIARGYPVIAPE
ncbi:Rhodanese-related sulfurtransferase [Malonomonas rubra DSM 5091]|uniref:Rhodanese-related sulfurtransferase n=1 Tax=Malonomonas rubra DSM 5091 TaxID=1122189 RepID=A0A1M6IW15_MALRU|nr:rhodanese-like domain-containing protein [Malonomonas rubra]SHJ38617.1 Rhodanese-related sulfurtransferase [Malonomonas rubra DSM 5091]